MWPWQAEKQLSEDLKLFKVSTGCAVGEPGEAGRAKMQTSLSFRYLEPPIFFMGSIPFLPF